MFNEFFRKKAAAPSETPAPYNAVTAAKRMLGAMNAYIITTENNYADMQACVEGFELSGIDVATMQEFGELKKFIGDTISWRDRMGQAVAANTQHLESLTENPNQQQLFASGAVSQLVHWQTRLRLDTDHLANSVKLLGYAILENAHRNPRLMDKNSQESRSLEAFSEAFGTLINKQREAFASYTAIVSQATPKAASKDR